MKSQAKLLPIFRFAVLLCLFLISGQVFAWSLLGPDSLDVLYVPTSEDGAELDVLCVNQGLYLFEHNQWNCYSFGLLVRDAIVLNEDNVLVIMGDDSDSDGIYIFDRISNEYRVQYYIARPRFLEKHNNRYYVGGAEGLVLSDNGVDWDSSPSFSDYSCHAMTCYQNQIAMVVSQGNQSWIAHSSNDGEDWLYYTSNQFSALTYDWTGRLWAALDDGSRSAGLWYSDNNGEYWQNEFYAFNISCVASYFDYIFIGFSEPYGDYAGAYCFAPDQVALTPLNENLPNTSINSFSYNGFIDCYNVIACTREGAYETCDLPMHGAKEPDTEIPFEFAVSAHPNPFNSTTQIRFSLAEQASIQIRVFDILGREVYSHAQFSSPAGDYVLPIELENCANGIYFAELSLDSYPVSMIKLVLLK